MLDHKGWAARNDPVEVTDLTAALLGKYKLADMEIKGPQIDDIVMAAYQG